MLNKKIERALKRIRPLLMFLVFLLHVLILLIVAGGVFLLIAMALKSSLEVLPRVMLLAAAGFMAWLLWMFVPEFWKAWKLPRLRRG